MCEWGNTETVEVAGVPRDVDSCIVPLVTALNEAGMRTVASCCGHGRQPSTVALADGREVFVAPDFDAARRVSAAFPPIHP